MHCTILTSVALALSLSVIGLTERPASAQTMAKAQVANLIAKVENGVDDFRKYLENRGENAREASSTAQASGRKKRQEGKATRVHVPLTREALRGIVVACFIRHSQCPGTAASLTYAG
jgi:hypothetical protein